MIGRDFSYLYVAMCGEVMQSRRSGVQHEKDCPLCLGLVAAQHEETISESIELLNPANIEKRLTEAKNVRA